MIARSSAGDTTTRLAETFGVAKSTILGVLRANDVGVRRQPLTPEQVIHEEPTTSKGQFRRTGA